MSTNDKYADYNVEDFVWDEQFREWILSSRTSINDFWNNWLSLYPEKADIIKQAREIVLSLHIKDTGLSEKEIEEVISKMLATIDHPGSNSVFPLSERQENSGYKKVSYLPYGLSIAASVLLIVAGVWLFYKNNSHANALYAYDNMIRQSAVKLVESCNSSSVPLVIRLNDSSTVTLEENSRLSYSPILNQLSKRDVYLSGKAFFEVHKNSGKPFFVHASGIVTKVLGTSFLVNTDMAKDEVTVEVCTGRVEVYEQNSSVKSTGTVTSSHTKIGNGVILTPNQKVVYSGEKKVFQSSLVDEPVPIKKVDGNIIKASFVFDETPLSEVIKAIKDIYGIEIEVENESIYNCPFTGDLSDQSLYRKLDVICLSTKTTYEINNSPVVF
jgi:hypothetical protein